MKNSIFSKAITILGAIAMLVGVTACGQSNDSTKATTDGNGLKKVTFMLSWAPDTNHIGVYVAKNKGYFKQAGLDVDIVAVAQAGAEQAVNNGMADSRNQAPSGARLHRTLRSSLRRTSTARLSPRSARTNLTR